MTHFVGLVVAETEAELEALLQPYHEYECTGVEDQYVKVVDVTEDAKEARLTYGKPEHVTFRDFVGYWYGLDEESSRFVREGAGRPDDAPNWAEVDADGEVVRVFNYTNPDKKWDWWVVGGRWGNEVPGNTCLVKDVSRYFTDYTPSVLVDEDGWHAAKDWGWFGSSTPSDEPDAVKEKFAQHADKRVWVVDFHI